MAQVQIPPRKKIINLALWNIFKYPYCGWLRNSASPKGWFKPYNEMFTTYQLENFATMHRMNCIHLDKISIRNGSSLGWFSNLTPIPIPLRLVSCWVCQLLESCQREVENHHFLSMSINVNGHFPLTIYLISMSINVNDNFLCQSMCKSW